MLVVGANRLQRRSATLSARARQLTPEAFLEERTGTKDGYGAAGANPRFDSGRNRGRSGHARDRARALRRPLAFNRLEWTRRPRAAVVARQDGLLDRHRRPVRPSHPLVV